MDSSPDPAPLSESFFVWAPFPHGASWRKGHTEHLFASRAAARTRDERDECYCHVYIHSPTEVYAEARSITSVANVASLSAWTAEHRFESLEEAKRWAEAVARLT